MYRHTQSIEEFVVMRNLLHTQGELARLPSVSDCPVTDSRVRVSMDS